MNYHPKPWKAIKFQGYSSLVKLLMLPDGLVDIIFNGPGHQDMLLGNIVEHIHYL